MTEMEQLLEWQKLAVLGQNGEPAHNGHREGLKIALFAKLVVSFIPALSRKLKLQRKIQVTAIFVSLAMTAFNCDVIAGVTQSHAPTGHAVKERNPKGCVTPWPNIHTLTGRLIGNVIQVGRDTLAATRDSAGKSGKFAQLFLWLKNPIVVCAGSSKWESAYTDVHRIAIGNFSYPLYQFIVKHWSGQNVQIKGNISVSASGYLPGPIRFFDIKEVCSSTRDKRKGNIGHCVPYKDWPKAR